MTDAEEVVLRDTLQACDAILKAIEGRPAPASGAGLVMALMIVAHDDGRQKEDLLAYMLQTINQSWHLFTRTRVEKSIRELRRRMAH